MADPGRPGLNLDALHEQLVALPTPYQQWVIRSAQSRGVPTLRSGASLGAGELSVYSALIGRCERELASRTPNGDQ
jgi:hypothetical protein